MNRLPPFTPQVEPKPRMTGIEWFANVFGVTVILASAYIVATQLGLI